MGVKDRLTIKIFLYLLPTWNNSHYVSLDKLCEMVYKASSSNITKTDYVVERKNGKIVLKGKNTLFGIDDSHNNIEDDLEVLREKGIVEIIEENGNKMIGLTKEGENYIEKFIPCIRNVHCFEKICEEVIGEK
jgi:DNA-binding transcriptional ArsR family regulator